MISRLEASAEIAEATYHVGGTVSYERFVPKLAKDEIDTIDSSLAEHFGLTHEELDFIINYDIKYRMGRDGGGHEGGAGMISRIEALNYRCLRYVEENWGRFSCWWGPMRRGRRLFWMLWGLWLMWLAMAWNRPSLSGPLPRRI